MVNTATDVNTETYTYSYGSTTSCGNSFPTEVSVPYDSLSTSMTWNCNGGVQLTAVDANSQTTTTTYNDPYFWRPASIGYPDNGSTSWTYNSSTSVTTTQALTSSQNAVSTTLLDGLGRLSQSELNSDPEGPLYTLTTYDTLGRIATVTNPYRSTSDMTYGLTTYQYDALSRPNLVIPPDGTSSTNNVSATYTNNCATVTDQAGKSRSNCANSLGYLTKIFENPAGLNYETDYTVDPLGNILSVTQKGGSTGSSNWRTRTYTYDLLSRLTQTADPESGTINYYYDANGFSGNLTSRVAPLPNQTGSSTVTTTYSYDVLHRLLQKSYSDGVTPTAQYEYDQSTVWGLTIKNPLGRRVLATVNGVGGMLFSYDPMGRVVTHGQCTPLNCSSITNLRNYVYNLAGQITSYTDTTEPSPGPITYTQTIDKAGRATQLTSSLVESGSYPATLAATDASVGYFPTGQIRKINYGNGLTGTSAYNISLEPCRFEVNSSSSYLSNCSAASPSGNLLDLTAGYNLGTANNGNIMSWSAVGNQTFNRTYAYDSLNRINTMTDSASGQACKGLSWTIDPWGNMTGQNVTSGSCLTFSASVGTNNQLSSPYTYDAAGNMTYDGTHHYTYDAENRLTQVDSGSTATYQYNADGQRIYKSYSGGAEDYLYNLDGQIIADLGSGNNWSRIYLYFGGQLVGEYANSTTYFAHSDHLGSSRMLTAMSQSPAENLDYYPFGELNSSDAGLITHEFTGFLNDFEANLDHADFRQYALAQARWLTPDPAGLAAVDPTNPQSWNRYAYVLNSPLTYIDPYGLNHCAPTQSGRSQNGPCAGGISSAGMTGDFPVAVINGIVGGPANFAMFGNSYQSGNNSYVSNTFLVTLGSLTTMPGSDSWWASFTSSFFGNFSIGSTRLPGESRTACINRTQQALLGSAGQTALASVSGVSLATSLLTASPGSGLTFAGKVQGQIVNDLGAQLSGDLIETAIAPKPSLAARVIANGVQSGEILPDVGAAATSSANLLGKIAPLLTAIGLGLEGGFALACR
jgi:RHS repeat-associated protein